MSLKVMGTDWRNPSGWTEAHRNRAFDAVSVAPKWLERPMRNPACTTLVSVQPALYLWDGQPLPPYTYIGALADEAIRRGYHIMDGGEFEVWRSPDGRQKLIALNISRREVGLWWAQLILHWFPWADGVHFDYWTSLGWLGPVRFPERTWRQWDRGLEFVAMSLRLRRPEWYLIGQQWHLTGITDVLNGLFLEQSPTSFGQTLESHLLDIKQLAQDNGGLAPFWVSELGTTANSDEAGSIYRSPLSYPLWYRNAVIEWCEDNGIYASWARDAEAGLGLL